MIIATMLIHQHMVPTMVVIEDELPKTSTGKIQKFLLREIDKGIALPSLFKDSLITKFLFLVSICTIICTLGLECGPIAHKVPGKHYTIKVKKAEDESSTQNSRYWLTWQNWTANPLICVSKQLGRHKGH